MPTSQINANNQDYLKNQLGLTLTNVAIGSTITLPIPTTLTTYRIYPGGKMYNVTALPSSISNTTLMPDPVNNPLGIYVSSSAVSIGSNVTITGTMICGGDVNITGSGVVINSLSMLPMSGTTTPVRLPAVVTSGSFYCN